MLFRTARVCNEVETVQDRLTRPARQFWLVCIESVLTYIHHEIARDITTRMLIDLLTDLGLDRYQERLHRAESAYRWEVTRRSKEARTDWSTEVVQTDWCGEEF